LNKNFTAQRIKKIAFSAQSSKNVELRKHNQIEFVKKNYKGNWEVLKKHKEIKIWTEQNKLMGDFKPHNPIDAIVQDLLDDKLQTKLRYLRLEKLAENNYEVGDCVKTKTELFMLEKDEDVQGGKGHLCFTYGGCVLLFDQSIYELSLQEVKKQISTKMIVEQNGMDKKSIDKIRNKIESVSMLVNF